MSHELFLTTRQKCKIRNAFDNNLLTDIKLGKVQLSKIIQSGGFLGKTLGNMMSDLGRNTLLDLAVSLAKMFYLKYQLSELCLR